MQASEGTGPAGSVDWEAVERSPEFQELVHRKRAFVAPRVVFFLGWYVAFVLLAGYAPDFMGKRIYEGFTVGYGLALTQFVMVWYLAWSYVRKADRDFDPLEEAAVAHIERGARDRTGRFERPDGVATPDVQKAGAADGAAGGSVADRGTTR
jgi:uncharacterized membrane protein (DUF485 family)